MVQFGKAHTLIRIITAQKDFGGGLLLVMRERVR